MIESQTITNSQLCNWIISPPRYDIAIK
ncbi:hypothetical protein ECPA39_4985, partial [Escherichia coli PA39]